jgi:hypothetical protein
MKKNCKRNDKLFKEIFFFLQTHPSREKIKQISKVLILKAGMQFLENYIRARKIK